MLKSEQWYAWTLACIFAFYTFQSSIFSSIDSLFAAIVIPVISRKNDFLHKCVWCANAANAAVLQCDFGRVDVHFAVVYIFVFICVDVCKWGAISSNNDLAGLWNAIISPVSPSFIWFIICFCSLIILRVSIARWRFLFFPLFTCRKIDAFHIRHAQSQLVAIVRISEKLLHLQWVLIAMQIERLDFICCSARYISLVSHSGIWSQSVNRKHV